MGGHGFCPPLAWLGVSMFLSVVGLRARIPLELLKHSNLGMLSTAKRCSLHLKIAKNHIFIQNGQSKFHPETSVFQKSWDKLGYLSKLTNSSGVKSSGAGAPRDGAAEVNGEPTTEVPRGENHNRGPCEATKTGGFGENQKPEISRNGDPLGFAKKLKAGFLHMVSPAHFRI